MVHEPNGTYAPSYQILDSAPLLHGYVYIPVFGLGVPWRPIDHQNQKAGVAMVFTPLNHRTWCLHE